MNISNAVYRDIKLGAGVTLPLRAGTPIGLNGLVCNDENAVGLLPQTVSETPLSGAVRVLVAGEVLLSEVEASFGESLTEAALSAMSGIRFFGEDGTPVPDYLRKDEQYKLPAATEETIGGVKTAATVGDVPTGESAAAADNAAAINALFAALKAAGLMTPITVTQQPQDKSGHIGDEIEVPLTAVGSGLTYEWWFKNPSSSSYSKSNIVTDTYTVTLSEQNKGRKIYCVITDGAGASVTSRIATITKA